MGKKLELSCPRYGRHVTRIEQNGSCQPSQEARSRLYHSDITNKSQM